MLSIGIRLYEKCCYEKLLSAAEMKKYFEYKKKFPHKSDDEIVDEMWCDGCISDFTEEEVVELETLAIESFNPPETVRE